MQDSNPRPSVYKTAALPTELIRPWPMPLAPLLYSTPKVQPSLRAISGVRPSGSKARGSVVASCAHSGGGDQRVGLMVVGLEAQPRGWAAEPFQREVERGAAAQLHAGESGAAQIDARVDLDDRAAVSGSGSIGQIATLPSSRWSKRMPEKLALATCAAPIAS